MPHFRPGAHDGPSAQLRPGRAGGTAATTAPPASTPSISAAASAQPYQSGNGLISEPVDAITGAYVYNNADLTIGNGALPYALQFGRTYSSASNMVDVGFGNGWTHTYSISAARSSDPYAGLGEGSAKGAVASIAALYVAQDLLTQPLTVQNLTLAWFVSHWLTDQLTNNAVLVSQPATNEEFLTLPRSDGASSIAYSPPLGAATALIGSSVDAYGNPTVFTYVTKDQRRLTFNPLDATNTGSIASLALPSGASLSFTYGYPYNGLNYLTQVSNNLAAASRWPGREAA